jgi:hypothetical protein
VVAELVEDARLADDEVEDDPGVDADPPIVRRSCAADGM